MLTSDPTHLLAPAATASGTLLAHGGRFTWDEALMVAIPIAIFAGILVTANRRAKELQAERDAELDQAGPEVEVEDPS